MEIIQGEREGSGEVPFIGRDVCGAAVLPHSLSLCICMALGDAHIKGYGDVIHQDYKGLQFQIKALQRSDIQPRASWSGIPADAFSFSPPPEPTDLLVMALHPLSTALTVITLVVPKQWISYTELGSRGSWAGMQTLILCTMIALLNSFIVQISAGIGKRG